MRSLVLPYVYVRGDELSQALPQQKKGISKWFALTAAAAAVIQLGRSSDTWLDQLSEPMVAESPRIYLCSSGEDLDLHL